MGWILKMATSTPLKAPKSMATTQAMRNATIMGAWRVPSPPCPTNTRRITEPAMATAAPTLMSCPPQAAVTRVMPMAKIATSEP